MDDPTMQIVELMNDPEKWVVVPNVPIFKPHQRKRTVKEGGKEVEKVEVIDKTRLAAIAAKINRQADKHGIFPRLAVGHTIPDKSVPQAQQPPVVGFARNAKLGRFGPTKEVGLLVDMHYRRDTYDEAKKHIYRSVEFYPGNNEITTIALLSVDPMLDLGIVIPPGSSNYYRDDAAGCLIYERGDGCVYFQQESLMPKQAAAAPLKYDADNDADDSRPANPPAEKERDEEVDETGGGEGAAQQEPVEDEKPDEEFHKHFMRSCAYAYPHLDSMHKEFGNKIGGGGEERNPEMPTEESLPPDTETDRGPPPDEGGEEPVDEEEPIMNSAFASPTNGGVPAPAKEKETPLQAGRKEQPTQYQRELEKTLKAQQKQLVELAASNKEMQLRYARSESERTVAAWEQDGILLKDRDKEVEKLIPMSDDARKERDIEVRENYQRDTAGAAIIPVARGAVAKTQPSDEEELLNEDRFDEVTQYMRDNKATWEVAKEKVRERRAKAKTA